MNAEKTLDYKALYNEYWQVADRTGLPKAEASKLARLIAETCGAGTVVDIGCGDGVLVESLLAYGIDAIGLDVSDLVVGRANRRIPGRFVSSSALSVPYPDAHFDTVVSTAFLSHLTSEDVVTALREMHRISSRYVFLQITVGDESQTTLQQTLEGRSWWEARCFEAGFRKHALYYRANPYEALNDDGSQIFVLLEKVPVAALQLYDLSVLTEERLLHTDMLREVGRRSDAHCIRYHKAAEFIRPGDRVLDVACGLGYGSYILYSASQAQSVLGVDLSDFGIAYANAHYGLTGAVEFKVGDAQALSAIADHSIDFIAAFETIEHVPEPMAYLRELKRVLKPTGRVMVCAPNNWADETGRDPNPHHLHVYTWERLVAECGAHFLLEQGFLQTAGGAMKCHHSPRKWVAVPAGGELHEEAEWILLLGMVDPVAGKDVPYRETVWALPDSPEFHVSAFARDYLNPWLVKGMVSIGMRARSPAVLSAMQDQVLVSAPPDSVDYGAALCGRAYAFLQMAELPEDAREALDLEIRRYAAIPDPSPHQLRWQVSLLFAGGDLAKRQGRFGDAQRFFLDCAARDVIPYSPLLGNKVLEALYWLAVMALTRHEKSTARAYLLRGVNEAKRLVSGSWVNISGDPESPLPFGLAEITQLLDKASRAAYMLSVIDSVEVKNGLVWQESLGFYERQLMARDLQLAGLGEAVDGFVSELTKLNGTNRDLASQVAERDAHAQALALEVAKQDAHAQSLALEVAKQDAHAQNLAREIVARDAMAQKLAAQTQIQIERLQSVIDQQNATLAYFRPSAWPSVLRKLLKKFRR